MGSVNGRLIRDRHPEITKPFRKLASPQKFLTRQQTQAPRRQVKSTRKNCLARKQNRQANRHLTRFDTMLKSGWHATNGDAMKRQAIEVCRVSQLKVEGL